MSGLGELRIVATGDVVPTQPLGPEGDLPAPVRAALAELRAADVGVGALEAPLTDRGIPAEKVVVYRAPPAVAADVAALGYDVVSLANNQTLNYGLEGLRQTMRLLEAHGVRHVGAGETVTEAWKPQVFERKGVAIAIVAFTCVAPLGWAATSGRAGLAALRVRTAYEPDVRWEQEEPGVAPRVRTWIEEPELARARNAVERAATEATAVVVCVHWGVGGSVARTDYQQQLGDALVEAGATCVLGGHPPPLQGLKCTGSALVCYSQGTFIRQQPRPPELAPLYDAMPRSGCLLSLTVAARGGVRASIMPTLIGERDMAGLARGDEGGAVLEELLSRSELIGSGPVLRQGRGLELEFGHRELR